MAASVRSCLSPREAENNSRGLQEPAPDALAAQGCARAPELLNWGLRAWTALSRPLGPPRPTADAPETPPQRRPSARSART